MKTNITGRHVDITEGLNNAVTSKTDKLAKRYPDIDTINVILTVEKNQQSAEAVIRYFGQDLVAKASSDDLYLAITEMANKLETLLGKRKEMVKSHHHEKSDSIELGNSLGLNDDIDEDEKTPGAQQ
jgi:putative sigma-54 modulation protein